ncbi:hypothetical protein GCM10022403_089310 [Streptomyces coacervatus]|uniref:Secreted protein n=1 Tax=Streptomyces coacervatus TaxID=647381 RepID=A0ABP7JH46_9ACTN|nr:hypothetical protein [Streptomyces coacervatus]MDF2271223.1 hypothetical protein [Streptomyces coacervatus]
MTENQNAQVGEVSPVELVPSEAPHAPDAPVEPAVPPGKPLRRGRIAVVAGSVLLAGAVVAGVGYTVVTVNGADRDAGAPVYKFPKDDRAEKAKPASAKGLAGTLVPYGADGWSRGPDMGEFGSDAELSGAEATALRKEPFKSLPRTQRKRLEEQIDKERIKGMAMRSYVSTDETSAVYTDKASVVSIELAQMDNRAAVRRVSQNEKQFLGALGLFRAGPAIEGHKNAGCFLSRAFKGEKLDWMFCTAYQGDVLVTVTANSARPMEAKGIGMLLKEQLDRIAEPGEAV